MPYAQGIKKSESFAEKCTDCVALGWLLRKLLQAVKADLENGEQVIFALTEVGTQKADTTGKKAKKYTIYLSKHQLFLLWFAYHTMGTSMLSTSPGTLFFIYRRHDCCMFGFVFVSCGTAARDMGWLHRNCSISGFCLWHCMKLPPNGHWFCSSRSPGWV